VGAGVFAKTIVVVAGLLLATAACHAQDVRLPKDIRIIVGSGVGGGYDAYARLVAPFLSRYLPGSPPVIVQNMPGGGGLKLANYMAQVAPRDGGTIAITNRNLIAAPLLGMVERNNVQYDPAALTWIANMTSDVSFLILRPEIGIRGIDDLRTRTVLVGSTSRADNNGVFPFVANNLLGTRFKVISGYGSSSDMLLAMERAEIDGIVGFSWASLQVQRPAWLEGRRERLIMQLGLEPLPQARDIPRMLDFARTPLDRQALELLATLNTLGRPFFGPPGLTDPVTAVLRDAFEKVAKDPALLELANREKLDVTFMRGSDLQSTIRKMVSVSPEVAAAATRALESGDPVEQKAKAP
jgi:tripartite-type tricarboxylate transporter receptor subunit TctC